MLVLLYNIMTEGRLRNRLKNGVLRLEFFNV
jgi:hypothetical protein